MFTVTKGIALTLPAHCGVNRLLNLSDRERLARNLVERPRIDQKFVAELVKFRAGKESAAKSLANVTTMLALLEACTNNVDLCLKMESL